MARHRRRLAPVPARDVYKQRQAVAMVAAAAGSPPHPWPGQKPAACTVVEDLPDSDHRYEHRILAGGLDRVWTAPDPVAPQLITSEAVA